MDLINLTFLKLCEDPSCRKEIQWHNTLKVFINTSDGKPHKETCNYSSLHRVRSKDKSDENFLIDDILKECEDLHHDIDDLQDRINSTNGNVAKVMGEAIEIKTIIKELDRKISNVIRVGIN